MKALILIEHVDRERELALYLKSLLLEGECDKCDIFSLTFHMWKVVLNKYDLIFIPYATRDDEYPLSILKDRFSKSTIVSLNLEQILHKGNMEFKSPIGNYCVKKVKHLYYHDGFSEMLLQAGVPDYNLIKTRPYSIINFSNISPVAPKANHASKRILVLSSFPWAFITDRQIKLKIQNGYSKVIAQKYRDYSAEEIEAYMQLLYELSDINGVEVIFRPHPTESVSVYRNKFLSMFGSRGNVRFDASNTAYDWIMASDLVIGAWSTLLYDTSLLYPHKVKRYNSKPLPDFFINVSIFDNIQSDSKSNILEYVRTITRNEKYHDSIVNMYNKINIGIPVSTIRADYNSADYYNFTYLFNFRNIFFLARSIYRYVASRYFGKYISDRYARDYFDISGL